MNVGGLQQQIELGKDLLVNAGTYFINAGTYHAVARFTWRGRIVDEVGS
jgi:hypothetical protein